MKWKNKRPGRFSKVLWSSLLYLRIYNNSRIIERSGCARQHTLVFLKAGNRGRLLFETNVNSCIIVGKKDFHTVVAPIRYSVNMKEALENSITFQYFA